MYSIELIKLKQGQPYLHDAFVYDVPCANQANAIAIHWYIFLKNNWDELNRKKEYRENVERKEILV